MLGCSAGMVATGLTSPGPAPNGWCSRGVRPADTHTHLATYQSDCTYLL